MRLTAAHPEGLPIGVVIPCSRQERFLPRTIAALEEALAGRDWRGALVIAAPSSAPLPALSERWTVLAPPVAAPLTPGAARMLGCAACGGEWVLFVDADVEVDAAWVTRALDTASGAPPALAGVWGRLEEWFVDPETGAPLDRTGSADMYRVGDRERDVDYLATLSFYRRDALLQAGGYDARLRSEEDFELGLRLRGRGYVLRSLGQRAARHWSAPRPSFGELARRWSTGLCFGQGQVLRLYLGRPGFAVLLRRQSLYVAALALWAAGLAAAALALSGDARALAAWSALLGGVLLLMSVRKRSARLALHSLLTWTLNGLGLVVGLFLPFPGGARRPASPEASC